MSDVMTGPTYSGVIGVSPITVNVAKAAMPGTYTLVSVDAARKIEFSADGGTSFFQPVYDFSPAAFITVSALAPITHVKFTSGTVTDKWTVL